VPPENAPNGSGAPAGSAKYAAVESSRMIALDMLQRAGDEFDWRVGRVRNEQLTWATPCERWNVRDLLQHVIAGNRMAVVMLEGHSRDRVDELRREVTSRDQLGDDPAAAFASSAGAQASMFGEPGVLERICHHFVGDIFGAQLLGFRIGDLTLHGWDLARAIDVDDHLDDDLVEFVYAAMSPMAATIGQTGLFGQGPTGAMPANARLQDRLLDLTGRLP